MHLKIINLSIKIILLLLLTNSCYSQKTSTKTGAGKLIEEDHNISIWLPKQNEESYNLKVSDTTTKELNIIFERGFDDSVRILINSKEILSKRIKTLRNLSVVVDEFKINYEGNENSIIEIMLVDKMKKISFFPKSGYVICYINRISEIWSLEFTNYQRLYY